MSYKRSKLKLRVFLAGHIVSMVNYWATKLTATYSPMIVQFVDDVGVNKYRVVIITHQTLSLEKYWELFPAALTSKPKRQMHFHYRQSNVWHFLPKIIPTCSPVIG